MRFVYITLLSIFLTLCGCVGRNSSTDIATNDAISNIENAADNIDAITENDPEIKPQTDTIRDSASDVRENHNNLNDKYQETLKALEKEKDTVNRWIQRCLGLIIIAAGLGVAVSIALFIMGNIKSLTATIILLSLLGGAITLQFLLANLIWIALGCIIIVVGLVIYHVFTREKANKETTLTVDEARKQGIIDWDRFTKVAKVNQTKTTEKIVDQFQKKSNKK